MTRHLSNEMSVKLDNMIALGKHSVPQMAKACGTTENNVKTRRKRRRQTIGQGVQIVVPPSSTIKEGSGPQSPECTSDVPATPAGVMAELQRMLKRQKEMEKTLKNDGPQAMPAILAILGQQRSTIDSILKAMVVFANMPDIGPRETPEQRMADTKAFFSKLIEGAPSEVRDWILRAMTESASDGAPELRHCETETPEFSKTIPENNGNCRIPEGA